MMINYIIIDDEYIAHDIIKGYCGLLSNMRFLTSCYNALEAITFLSNNQVDLIFLDLNLPKLKGFEFIRTLHNPPKIIVTTAYKEFALEGYELNITDYLLKPFGFERFLKAINKTINTPPTTPAKVSESPHIISNHIILRSNKKYIQIEADTIQYIEASGNYTKVITTADTTIIREKFQNVLELLSKNDFLQVHKSFAIAVKRLKSVEGNRIFIADSIIPIGKVYKTNINRLLNPA